MWMARIYFTWPCQHWNAYRQNHSRLMASLTAVSILLSVLLLLFLAMYEIRHLLNTRQNLPSVVNIDTQHLKTFDLQTSTAELYYAIVLDCGSSGTRVYIYFWPRHSGNPKDLLNIQQLVDPSGDPIVKKIAPGLSTFENKPGEASDYIKKLLDFAASHIPQKSHKETLLYILATAGMRLIPESAQLAILEDLRRDIPKDFKFVVSDNNFEVISGKQEGVYAWIAVNYILEKFTHGEEEHSLVAVEVDNAKTHIRRRTVGIIDMGGGSVQIGFEVTGKNNDIPKDLVTEINLGCQTSDRDHTYRIYVTTFLEFGANEARERYEDLMIKSAIDEPNSTILDSKSKPNVIQDPCFSVNYIHSAVSEKNKDYSFKGTGDYRRCKHLLRPLLNQKKPCGSGSCSMNGVFQPSIDFSRSDFYGFSEFWYTTNDVYKMGVHYDYEKFEHNSKEFCSKEWSTLKRWHKSNLFPHADKDRFRLQCFKAAWMSTVLHKGFKFPKTYNKFHLAQLIRKRDAQWTLGALLYRTRYLPLREVEKPETQSSKIYVSGTSKIFSYEYIVFTSIILLIIIIILFLKRLNCWPWRRKGMNRVPSLSYLMTEPDQIEQGTRYIKGYTYS